MVNRLEDTGYLTYDDGLFATDDRVREATLTDEARLTAPQGSQAVNESRGDSFANQKAKISRDDAEPKQETLGTYASRNHRAALGLKSLRLGVTVLSVGNGYVYNETTTANPDTSRERLTAMSDQRSTRRTVLESLVGVGLGAVAGCGGRQDGSTSVTARTERPETATATERTRTQTPTPSAGPREACMDPVGCLSFDTPPERWVANAGIYCDMGVALDLTDRLTGIGSPRRFYTGYYDQLPGVTLNKDDYPALARGTRMPKESFYAADADVHLIDPVWLINTFSWTRADVREITENVGPFFGNYIRERHDAWHDYRYYGLWEAFAKVAALFGRESRYEKLDAIRRDLTEAVRSRLPDERREVLLLRPLGIPPRAYFPQYLDDSVSDYQWGVVEVRDVLEGSGVPRWGTRIDYEGIAELDPEVIVMETQFADDFVLEDSFREYILGVMRDDPVAREVTAVENGDVYAGGINYQGPLASLFQVEHAAQATYPDEFAGDRLFDRDRVASAVTGEN